MVVVVMFIFEMPDNFRLKDDIRTNKLIIIYFSPLLLCNITNQVHEHLIKLIISSVSLCLTILFNLVFVLFCFVCIVLFCSLFVCLHLPFSPSVPFPLAPASPLGVS